MKPETKPLTVQNSGIQKMCRHFSIRLKTTYDIA